MSRGKLPTEANFYPEEEGEEGDFYDDDESSGSDDESTPEIKKPLPQPTSGFQALIQPVRSMFYGAIAEEEDEGEEAPLVEILKHQKPKQAQFTSAKASSAAASGNKYPASHSSPTLNSASSADGPHQSIPAKIPSSQNISSVASTDHGLGSQGSGGKAGQAGGGKTDSSKEKPGQANAEEPPKKKKKKKKDIIGVNLTLCKYDSVRRCIADMGWREVGDEDDWVIFWTDSSVSVERVMSLKRYQKINHFPGTLEIARKANMARNLRRMYKQFPNDYNIIPKTWLLPQELPDFRKVLKRNRNRTYILKPDAGSQGRGIYLVRKPEDIVMPENGPFPAMVAQQYLLKPLLIDGYKFDMRIYTLIMGCDPLKIFLYKEGMGRFCTETYQAPTEDNMENTYMHLTNYSINKFNDKFTSGSNEENFGEGSKRTMSAMKSILTERGIDWDQLWAKIADIIIKTMISVQPLLAHLYHTCVADDVEGSACFEILGFDIIIDHKLRPLLLEVNHSPSLTCDTPLDYYIKDNLLRSVCQLLKIDPDYKKRYRKEERARAQQRIFGNSRRKSEDIENLAAEKKDPAEVKEKEQEDILKWEEENIGNFTKIYPTADSAKYEQFFTAALNGIVGETQASIGKKLSTLKKLEEQEKPPLAVKLPKPNAVKGTDKKAPERANTEKILPDKITPDRASVAADKPADKKVRGSQEAPDTLPLDLSQPKESSIADESDPRKKPGMRSPFPEQSGNIDSSRSRGQSSSRTSVALPAIYDSPSLADLAGADERRDILGLTESQVHEMCLPISDDRYRNPDFQKRVKMMRAAGIREKVTQMIIFIQEAQKLAKQQALAQKLMRKEGVYTEVRPGESLNPSPVPPSKPKEEPLNDERRAGSSSEANIQAAEKTGRVSVYVPMHLRKQLLVGGSSTQVTRNIAGAVINQSKQRIMDSSKGYSPSLGNDYNMKPYNQGTESSMNERGVAGRNYYPVSNIAEQDYLGEGIDPLKSKYTYVHSSASPALRGPATGPMSNRGVRKGRDRDVRRPTEDGEGSSQTRIYALYK